MREKPFCGVRISSDSPFGTWILASHLQWAFRVSSLCNQSFSATMGRMAQFGAVPMVQVGTIFCRTKVLVLSSLGSVFGPSNGPIIDPTSVSKGRIYFP